jgi:hypothetical protein
LTKSLGFEPEIIESPRSLNHSQLGDRELVTRILVKSVLFSAERVGFIDIEINSIALYPPTSQGLFFSFLCFLLSLIRNS